MTVTATHGCGMCDAPLRSLGTEDGSYATFECTECGWWHTSADCCDMALAMEYIRGEIQAERISMGEIAWLQDNAAWIDPDDTELLQWAGVEEEDRYRPGQGTGTYLDNPEQGV